MAGIDFLVIVIGPFVAAAELIHLVEAQATGKLIRCWRSARASCPGPI
ncbi:MAG: hypothetical protein R3E89_10405 [Thiolinea sp.]